MLFLVDHYILIVRFFAPKHKDDALSLTVDLSDDLVCEAFPPFLLMTVRDALSHRQYRVE